MERACPICQNRKGVSLKDTHLNMFQCPACGHAFSIIARQQQVHYTEDYYNSTHTNWFNNPNYWLFRFIYLNLRTLVNKERFKLLDVGCGKGDFLKYIRSINPQIQLYGVDLCDNDFSDIDFTKLDFLKANYDKKCDVVCSMASIEHVDDIVLFVDRLRDLLLPDGIAVITTDNTGGIFYGLARLLKKIGITAPFYSLYEPAHLNHFTNRSLRKLMEREGFEVIAQTNHNYPVTAVDLPTDNFIMKKLYMLGVWILFSLPQSFGILQTIICRKKPHRNT